MRSVTSVVVLCLAGVACSSGSPLAAADGGAGEGGSSADAGGSPNSDGLSRAIFTAKLVANAANPSACRSAGQSLSVGSFAPATPIVEGTTTNDGRVTVFCEVTAGNHVNVNLELPGSGGGQFTLLSQIGSTGVSTEGIATLRLQGGSFSAPNTCVVDTTAVAQGGIAAGRLWAGLKCTAAQDQAGMQTCDVEGELRVENCTQ